MVSFNESLNYPGFQLCKDFFVNISKESQGTIEIVPVRESPSYNESMMFL